MAETSRHERRRHFRGKPRPGRRLPVRWAAAGVWEVAETRNIGVGGAFIATEAPAPVGASILVELHIPTSERPFEARAIVRWRQAVAPAAADVHSVDAPGMGVEFVEVDIDVLLELNDYFATLSAELPSVR
jgi:uncharacterized protein (TIGR02266 family)